MDIHAFSFCDGSSTPRHPAGREASSQDPLNPESAEPLHLAGVDWPGLPLLAGHSDGDAACHALADAMLSAAGLPDIGGQFGSDTSGDQRDDVKGLRGLDMLEQVRALVEAQGFRLKNANIQIVAAKPNISKRRLEINAALSAAAGGPVNVSGTTSDGLGFTAFAKIDPQAGVVAIANCLLCK